MKSADFLVLGSGIVGLTIAGELAARYHGAKVVVLEKEASLGAHASGRNSGVLHAGFYYTADSMKARFTKQGNLALKDFCEARGLKINKCGKLVVARDEKEHQVLDTLLARAEQNEVELWRISKTEAREIEPRVKTFENALWSPTTASVDPMEVMGAMADEARDKGVEILLGMKYQGRKNGTVLTNDGAYEARYVVNAAGLYADRIAKDFGFAKDYYLLPFKGLYLYSDEAPGGLTTNIYPVPNLANPFLGVHFTVGVGGRIKIGPTAIPAFWREQYGWADNFSSSELLETIIRQAGLFMTAGFDFRRLASEEIRKYFRPNLVQQAGELAEGVRVSDYRTWGRPGIRAQLVNQRTKTLEMDFITEGDDRSMHVLNAVSPAFTCSLPFAKHVVDKIDAFRIS